MLGNALSSKIQTRKENLKKRGKQILQLIETLSREKQCQYITLDALEDVITYYHLFGYALVHYPFHVEKPETTEYVNRLGHVNNQINQLNERQSTNDDRKKDRMKDLTGLLRENEIIKGKLKRYMVGLYSDNDRANFTGLDFEEELMNDGYRMYKVLGASPQTPD